EKAGAKVIYSYEDKKVHTKLLCIDQSTSREKRYLSYLSTGNFNSNTAKIYSDFALLTSDQTFGTDIVELFRFFTGETKKPKFQELSVAPFALRQKIVALIDTEIKAAKAGKSAMLTMKMNSLQDEDIIKRLYKASEAGVKIRLIIRGICSLVPGVKGLSENIEIRSIVDRYLEHSRIYWSHSKNELYLSSADMMTRNLNGRIEVAFIIKDPKISDLIKEIIQLQWSDNVKSRKINVRQSNPYYKGGTESLRSQYATYDLLSEKNKDG
ncbi:MAG: polyphosphate kinase 1, partial [Bacteroidia bacterium]|nr:polyphosphate kinase 1 [Bacteroidia bacterium]